MFKPLEDRLPTSVIYENVESLTGKARDYAKHCRIVCGLKAGPVVAVRYQGRFL